MKEIRISTYFENDEQFVTGIFAHRLNKRGYMYGSAIYIAPGIFITARHVVEEGYLIAKNNRFADITEHPQNIEAPFESDVLHVMKDKQFAAWPIRKAYFVGNSDVAIAVCERSNDENSFKIAGITQRIQIDLHPPVLGSNVLVTGYTEMTNELEKDGSIHEATLMHSSGSVEELYAEEDNISKTAAFQTNAAIKGGMSGGPAFNSDGALCGMNSNSFDPTDEYPDHASLVTLFLGAFGTEIEIPQFGKTTLLEMAKKGYISVKGLDHLELTDDGKTRWKLVEPSCQDCNAAELSNIR